MNNIKNQLDALLKKSPKQQIEFDAQMLALQFLSLVDQAMESQKVSKKDLGEKIGKSPAFITQLFKGNRKPNWNILAQMQRVLDLNFKVLDAHQVDQWMKNEMEDYKRMWSRSDFYGHIKKDLKTPKTKVPNENLDFAMAA